jgi:hypothetical protein
MLTPMFRACPRGREDDEAVNDHAGGDAAGVSPPGENMVPPGKYCDDKTWAKEVTNWTG